MYYAPPPPVSEPVSGIGSPEAAYVAPPPPPAPEQYYAPPPPAPEPVYYAPPRESAETYYEPEPVYYAPPPPVSEPEPAPVSGIGSPVVTSYEPEQTYTQATVEKYAEPEPVSGIGAPEVAYVAPQPEPAPVYSEPTPVAQPTPAAEQPAFGDDDYTGSGRMGPDGEPERYSTMPGGDPRVRQQRELEIQQQRLQAPISIKSWMTSGTKDVRGTDPAESITLQPGKQYQIVDFTGKNDGEIIASGSTPEEFLRMQDIAEGLNAQGRKADWRLQEVSDEPSESKFGSALEPTTGKYITTLGGDLYNKSGWSTVADVAKIAVPIALQFVPGFGQALGLKLGLKGVAAKAVGIGLTSAAGRAGTGVATGEKLGDALKAGAISGLASGATAGLLGTTGADKALSSAFGGAKGAIVGETAGKGVSEAAKKLAEEGLITVVASKTAPAVLSGISSASGSLLGDVGKSLVQPDPFQQALDQARVQNQPALPPVEADEILALGQRVAPTIPGTEALAPITGGALTAPLSPLDLPAQPTQPAQPPGEPEIVVTNTAPPPVDLSGIGSLPISVLTPPPPPPAPPVDTSLLGENTIDVESKRITPATLNATNIVAPGAGAVAQESSQTVSERAADQPQDQAEKDKKKGMTTFEKASAGLTLVGAAADAIGGDGDGGGPLDLGTGYTVPGAGSGIGRTRNVATFDPFTYGQKEGEFAFFGDGMAEGGEVDDDMVSHLIAYRKGGGHMGPGKVKGIGSGQDDKIPAWLSDGEYVWSAQDVADLGDGSTDEGVRRLDKMRQMVRKGAGRKDVKKIAKPQRGIEDMLKAVGGAV